MTYTLRTDPEALPMEPAPIALSPVEQIALNSSPYDRPYYPPTEKIPVLIVANFPALGKLVAMRFWNGCRRTPTA